ncbi:MAG TPA: hypothetical protein DEB40_03200 [Elusimicrobia bacterium]|nr:hypothetical protein [Elusimicrobiota bacterium]HBT60738.1 hypothetical protein [Elusimicrobiota bacterium]
MSLKDWQGRVIYFILIDRFFNGDASNDDFGKGEFDPQNDDCFQGGDLRGITQKLPHIKRLGFDAVWITPPVYNQWINPYIKTRGYHGYWAYDFTRVDPHFGTIEDFKNLVIEAHRLGIKVIQDIVVNHTGNYFTVEAKDFDPAFPERNWRSLDDSYPPEDPPKAPNDPLFRMNNPNVPRHKEAAVYNFTPNISDFNSREQTLGWSMGDLDDINLKNPMVIKRFKEIYRFWIDQVGVDAFRVDTVFYTPEEFYEPFLHDADPWDLGIKRFAAKRGKKDFLVFGEAWSYDYKAINRYIREGRSHRLDSAIDLPLNEALTQVFFRKLSTERLGRALAAKRHNRRLWVNFLDNHDVERINSRGSWSAVRQSLVALFTLPGIPCLTYGTEAGLVLARQRMFDESCFSERGKHAAFLKKLIALRRAHPAFSRGDCRVERTALSCGILAYEVSYHEESYRVVFNTAPDAMFYGLGSPGKDWEVILASEKANSVPDALVLKPESYAILKRARAAAPALVTPEPPGVELKPPPATTLRGALNLDFALERPQDAAEVALLADDNFDRRLLIASPAGRHFLLDTAALGNGRHRLRLLVRYRDGTCRLSASADCVVKNPYRLLAKATVRDEHKGGLQRKVHPPADPSYGRQLSIEEAALFSSGRDMRLRLRMSQVSSDWNPPHGYDHVYFHVFFDFPGQRGKKFLPKLDCAVEDFEFNAGFLLYGWGIRSFGAADSTREAYGAPLWGDVADAVDLKRRLITFTFSEKFFEGLKTFAGTKVFISTWDGYLGEPRAVAPGREDWNFYVLDDAPLANLPKIFDHILIKL